MQHLSTTPHRRKTQSRFRRVAWTRGDLAVGMVGVVAWLALPLVYQAAGQEGRRWLESAPQAVISLGPLLFLLGWMLVVPLWLGCRRRPHLLGRPVRAFPAVRELALALPIGLAAHAVSVGFNHLWRLAFGRPAEASWVRSSIGETSQWQVVAVFLLLAVTLGPVAEEVFYRGFVYNALRRRCRAALASVVQAALFAGTHFVNGAGFCALAFLYGLLLAAIYDWRRTLLAPVAVHVVVNLIGALLVLATVLCR